MGIVIDTSALVDIERRAGAEDAETTAWNVLFLRIGDQPAAIPAIVFAEALVGVELAANTKRAAVRRAHLDALIAQVPVVDFDAQIAQVWARLVATLRRSGQMIPANDLAVAATATHLAYAVLVGASGEKHFRAIDGLEVITIDG